MANLPGSTGKKPPGKKIPSYVRTRSPGTGCPAILATFIRLGESLDRSHAALIQHVRFSRADRDSVWLEILGRGDCQLEIWGIEAEKKGFEKTFSRKLIIEVLSADVSG